MVLPEPQPPQVGTPVIIEIQHTASADACCPSLPLPAELSRHREGEIPVVVIEPIPAVLFRIGDENVVEAVAIVIRYRRRCAQRRYTP